MTLKAMLDHYRDYLRRTARPTTIRSFNGARRRLLIDLGGPRDVVELVEKGELDRYVERLQRRQLAPSYINLIVNQLRRAWQMAVDDRLPGAPPPLREVRRVRPLRTERRLPTALTEDEMQALLDAAPGDRCRLAIALAMYAGLRREEILHLTWEDVGAEILVRGKAGWVPKSHAERRVPIGPSLRRELEILRSLTWVSQVCRKTGQMWLFQGHRGRRLGSIAHEVRAAFKAIGVGPERRPGMHMLRRTFATRLMERGAHIMVISRLLGHTSVEVTEGYLAVSPAAAMEACELL